MMACIALIASLFTHAPPLKLACFTFSTMGIFMAMGILWTFVPFYFASGIESAAAIAIINMISTMSGIIQPIVMGRLRVATGNYSAGLAFTAALMFAGVVAVLFLGPRHEVR
jgi:ACS family 4-hydroxyphenylacetate permease-like MFS transporter